MVLPVASGVLFCAPLYILDLDLLIRKQFLYVVGLENYNRPLQETEYWPLMCYIKKPSDGH
jgi:hypothetical protein